MPLFRIPDCARATRIPLSRITLTTSTRCCRQVTYHPGYSRTVYVVLYGVYASYVYRRAHTHTYSASDIIHTVSSVVLLIGSLICSWSLRPLYMYVCVCECASAPIFRRRLAIRTAVEKRDLTVTRRKNCFFTAPCSPSLSKFFFVSHYRRTWDFDGC